MMNPSRTLFNVMHSWERCAYIELSNYSSPMDGLGVISYSPGDSNFLEANTHTLDDQTTLIEGPTYLYL